MHLLTKARAAANMVEALDCLAGVSTRSGNGEADIAYATLA
jgi:hypothetical protein